MDCLPCTLNSFKLLLSLKVESLSRLRTVIIVIIVLCANASHAGCKLSAPRRSACSSPLHPIMCLDELHFDFKTGLIRVKNQTREKDRKRTLGTKAGSKVLHASANKDLTVAPCRNPPAAVFIQARKHCTLLGRLLKDLSMSESHS